MFARFMIITGKQEASLFTPKVYIVVLNYNGWQDTIECLESLERLTYTNCQIIVVDNCSQDNSMVHLQKWLSGRSNSVHNTNSTTQGSIRFDSRKPPQLNVLEASEVNSALLGEEKFVLIQTRVNLGFAGGNNVALKQILRKSDADYVWMINNDTVVEPASLSAMIEHQKIETNIPVGIVGCKIRYYHHPNVIQCIAGSYYNKWLGYSKQIGNGEIDEGQFDDIYISPDLINGACMLISISFLRSVGLMNEEYFLYFEEQDWAERAKRNGFLLSYCSKGLIYHKEGATIGGGQKRGNSRFSDFYYTRSKLLFTKRYFNDLVYLTVNLSLSLTIMNRVGKRQFDRILLIMKIMLNPRAVKFVDNKVV